MSFCYSLVELSERNKSQEFGTLEEKKKGGVGGVGKGTVLRVMAAPRKRKKEGETLKWVMMLQLAYVIFGLSILSKASDT